MGEQRKANGIDQYIGSRVRAARNLAGFSQEVLGDKLGVTFQQIQKYEKGTNRITVGRALHIARELGVTLDWLLEGAPGYEKASDSPNSDIAGDFFSLPYARDIAKDYIAIGHNVDRSAVWAVTQALARKSDG